MGLLFYAQENRDKFFAMDPPYKYTRTVNAALNSDLARYDLNPEPPKLKMPTLVVTGRLRSSTSRERGVEDPHAIPNSRVRRVREERPSADFEERDAFVARLEQFLGR